MFSPVILYEDNHLLIISKPAGWLVQGDQTGDDTLLDWGKEYIKKKYNKPGAVFLNPVHRLDRPVSGIVVFGRTSKSLERMNKQFREDEVEKTYLAIVAHRPEDIRATLTHWLSKDGNKNVSKAFDKEKRGSKRSILTYDTIISDGGHSVLIVKPKTGRSHQIRVQLAKVKCPIQGDLKYGYTKPNMDKSISLHAFKLSFVHPVKKKKMLIKCVPSTEIWKPYKETINELD